MAAHQKVGPIEVEQIVAARGAGRSYRQIAAALGVSHSTVSRRIASDPFLRVRISAAEKREARRARDRERKRRAKARREAGLAPGSPPEQVPPSSARPSPDSEHEPGERALEVAADAAHSPRERDPTPHPGRCYRREQPKLARASKLHCDLVWMYREGENRNFEPDEVEAALAHGWRRHE